METLSGFITHEWALWAAFFVILALLVGLELKEYFLGPSRLTPQQATQLINRENAIVLDVREMSSFAKGHIIDAIHIPFSQLEAKGTELDKYKERPIIVVCENDRQAGMASKVLRKQGLKQVFSIQGGINAWQSASLPLRKVS